MTDVIHLTHHAQALLRFHDASPLAGCSLTDWDGGVQIIKADRFMSQLSESERLCWGVADRAARGLPVSKTGLGIFLDGPALAAVQALLEACALDDVIDAAEAS